MPAPRDLVLQVLTRVREKSKAHHVATPAGARCDARVTRKERRARGDGICTDRPAGRARRGGPQGCGWPASGAHGLHGQDRHWPQKTSGHCGPASATSSRAGGWTLSRAESKFVGAGAHTPRCCNCAAFAANAPYTCRRQGSLELSLSL